MKKQELGRSMVEMLGVLAVIGVLSVGGIAGYTLSMRRHRANGIADIASKYALVVYGQCQQQLLNGDITSISSCSEVTSFKDAGIGNIPSGVTADYAGEGIRFESITSNTTTGVDTVYILVNFSDNKLCQALGAITGTGCGSGGSGPTQVIVQVKQN
ncbi:MAG: hypothetical protein IJY92_05940 [Alphaproteobacteria bacterium]|nr:hypothetical protein [Alphaproteobacteria bacterium]